jgi:hypothetical protein
MNKQVPMSIRYYHPSIIGAGEINLLTTFLNNANHFGKVDKMRKEFIKDFPYADAITDGEAILAAIFLRKYWYDLNANTQLNITSKDGK